MTDPAKTPIDPEAEIAYHLRVSAKNTASAARSLRTELTRLIEHATRELERIEKGFEPDQSALRNLLDVGGLSRAVTDSISAKAVATVLSDLTESS